MKLVIVLALCLSVLVAVAAANNLSAQTTTTSPDATTTTIGKDTTSTPTTSPTTTSMTSPFASASPATSTGTPVVLNLVEITRMVPAGTTAVTAFTVPAGRTLIITDALVTNTSETAICGAAINRAGAAAAAAGTPTTTGTTSAGAGSTATSTTTGGATGPTVAGTITQSDLSITGPLCVAPRTTTPLPFTTGIEFGPGQTVQLMNVPDATTATGAAATAAPGAIGFHLRGMLVAT